MNRFAKVVLILVLLGAVSVCASAQITLNAAGATFPYPIYSKWFNDYNKLHPNV